MRLWLRTNSGYSHHHDRSWSDSVTIFFHNLPSRPGVYFFCGVEAGVTLRGQGKKTSSPIGELSGGKSRAIPTTHHSPASSNRTDRVRRLRQRENGPIPGRIVDLRSRTEIQSRWEGMGGESPSCVHAIP